MKQINYLLNLYDFNYNDEFIETGTCYGDTVNRAIQAGFKSIQSVEFYDSFFNQSQSRFIGANQVKLWHGKSVDKLTDMIRDVKTPITFFLDAHPCGPNTGGHDDLMWHIDNGSESEFHQHTILMRELGIIAKHPIKTHTILIDDQAHTGDRPFYQDFILKNINPNYKFYMIGDPGWYSKDEKILLCIPEEVEIVNNPV